MNLEQQLFLLSVPVPEIKVKEWNQKYSLGLKEGDSFLDVLKILCIESKENER